MANIGFLGTGNMGIGMAKRLLGAGHRIRVFNRTRPKAAPLVEKGAVLADTPRQAAEGVDVVMAMVGDDEASRAMWMGDDGVLAATPAKNALAIECSTLSHGWVIELSAIVKARGLSYLDCPVTGLPEAAASGALTLFLGGDQQTIARAQPYLKPLSTAQIHFGRIGAGTSYKLIVNLMGSIQIVAAAQGMLVAEKAGLDLKMVARALGSGGAGSPQVSRSSKFMAVDAFDKDVMFNAYWRLKDTRYGVEFAEKMGQQTPFGKIAEALFQQVVDAGHAGLDESKVIDMLRD